MKIKIAFCVSCCLYAAFSFAADEGPGTYFDSPKGTANVTSNAKTPANAKVHRTVAFLGGSITEMNGFRPCVMRALAAKYPEVAFTEIAAGLSSTCSDTGAFRLEEDILSKGTPDLFVVEASVNDDQDGHFNYDHCVRGMEGSVRHVLTVNPRCAVVVGLLINKGQYRQCLAGKTPLQFAAHAAVARHYGAAVADVGSALAASEKAGSFAWEDYRDCHPTPKGCDFAADVFLKAIATVFDPTKERAAAALPAPLDTQSYAAGRTIHPRAFKPAAGWHVSEPDWAHIPGIKRAYFSKGPALWSETPGAVMEIAFEGPVLAALLTGGDDAGAVEVSVDGGAFARQALRSYAGLNYPYTHFFAEGLPPGPHVAKLRVASVDRKGKACSAVRIHRIAVNAPACATGCRAREAKWATWGQAPVESGLMGGKLAKQVGPSLPVFGR